MLPSLVIKWTGREEVDQIWISLAEVNDLDIRNQAIYFSIFLARLWNECPRENGAVPETLRQNISKLLGMLESEYKKKGLDFRQCDFLNGIFQLAEDSVGTCVDRLKVGYVKMQLEVMKEVAMEETAEQEKITGYLTQIELISQFVIEVSEGRILYDQTEKSFVLESFVLTSEEGQNRSYSRILITDQIEDALQLIYKLGLDEGVDVHQLDMRYQGCCAIRESSMVDAAMRYIADM